MRPREQFERFGPENLSVKTLLAILLRSGTQGLNVIDLASALLEQYGSLRALAQVSADELSRVKGLGRVKAQVLKSAFELARRLTEESSEPRLVRTPRDAADILRDAARSLEIETFWILMLDTKNRLKRPPYPVSRGILGASLVHPREVFKEAIRSACAAIVLVHNHPSGDPTPSSQDLSITKKLVQTGQIVDIAVLDHVIIGGRKTSNGEDFFSLREAGVVSFGD